MSPDNCFDTAKTAGRQGGVGSSPAMTLCWHFQSGRAGSGSPGRCLRVCGFIKVTSCRPALGSAPRE